MIQCATIFTGVAVVAYQIAKSREIPTKFDFIAAQGVIDLGVNRKPICDFLLVINSNFGRISYRF